MMTVELKVRELAEQRGLNITTLARKAEISLSQASKIWHNRVIQLEFKTLGRLANALNVSIGDLFVVRSGDNPDGDVVEFEGNQTPVLMPITRYTSARVPFTQRRAA